MSTDELVSQFMSFSGCSDPQQALSYLEMSGNQVETAVGLYMEHQGGGGGGAAGAVGGAGSPFGAAELDVRAPDRTRTMRLMDDVSHHHPGFDVLVPPPVPPIASAFSAVPSDVRAAVNAAAAGARDSMKENNGGDNDDDDDEEDEYMYDDNDDDEEEEKADDDQKPPAPSGLTDMFAPPTHLMHSAGGFQGARQAAKDARRWLLVNIQRDAEFSSHALNRDVWRDELVENLIREGFIFWQTMDVAPEGRTYAQRYAVMDYPHVAILDPRTGRSLWKKEGWTQERPLTAERFAESAMDFCSRHSFDEPPRAGPRATGPAAKSSKPQMSAEEQQLQAALAASLNQNNSKEEIDMTDDNDDSNEVEVMEHVVDSKPAAEQDMKPPSRFLELLDEVVEDEPSSSASRVQIRMMDGKRLVRKFANTSKVSQIYAVVARENEDTIKEGKEFVLMAGFPPKDIWDKIDETVQSCQLNGQSIAARWKD
mmetsp:Transcript_36259/g.54128  ORF Transcript_36259/g.54128 Transcript_36259/m.54128 type:complete len:481 (-) Transcript_36259:358-1800(-)|eukprot:CAMPEP_0194048662 /NCGR_PEP_ID=MMETSP0009_2-20130614/28049_1 /TAXON_ID=210454 /ORGANISM="Grammatophora oceanica, Strain CCMP 410" /LENGTH=480 /DNA_ID=CAMNT_0038694593 /DNA_START=139 /DNA_END=1581 /DNA_ORIENTATION=+